MQILHAALRFMFMIIDFMSNLLQQTHRGDNTDFLSKHTSSKRKHIGPRFGWRFCLHLNLELECLLKGHITFNTKCMQYK